MYDGATLTYSRNWHNTVNQRYFNKKRGGEKKIENGDTVFKSCWVDVSFLRYYFSSTNMDLQQTIYLKW